ncbi:hypothetical protein QTV43_000574 [Vibrio vulnificus]|nr:hypothetical protein [Vibrio vulnificus]
MLLKKMMLSEIGLDVNKIPDHLLPNIRIKQRFGKTLPTTDIGFLLPCNTNLIGPISNHFDCVKLITADEEKLNGKALKGLSPLRFTHCESWVKEGYLFFVFAAVPSSTIKQSRTSI